jgi:hypothetical protein
MKQLPYFLTAVLLAAGGTASAADWKPAPGPLMTQWAKDVSPDKVHPEYPRPQLVRDEWQNLNGLWQLAFAKEGEAPPLGKDLPEQILVPFPVESALSGVGKRADRLWYRQTFTTPDKWSGRRVLLHFGAVDWETTVWVNGKQVGTHRGGYDPFHFDVTDALKPGGPQELVVGVFDPTSGGPQPRGKQVNRPQGIYYTPTTGIWQTVWLEPVPESSVAALKVVPDVDGGKVRVTVLGRGTKPGQTVKVVAGDGDAGGSAEGTVGQAIEIPLKARKLWSPDTPHLYPLQVQVRDGDAVVDQVQSYFGLRRVSVGPDDKGVTRLLLNGKPYFQVGPLDQGFWPDGLYTPPTEQAMVYDLILTQKLGFNMIRKHVKVEPARWYYHCDKMGILVWQDMPSGERSVAPGKGEIKRSPESAKQFELELRNMIDALHPFPCVVMWVVFNEGWGQYDTVRMTNWTKEYDPTRWVNCASGWNDMKCGDVHDIHVYPGPGSPKPEPTRAAVLGEFGGLGLGVDGHTWAKKNWSYQGTASAAELTRRYEKLFERVYTLKDNPGLSAAVYTQTTDVETEINGLLTYDRAVTKVDVERVAAANRGDFSRVPLSVAVVPTSQTEGAVWRYTTERPAGEWSKADFDDAAWKEGPGGFGTEKTPGAVVRTQWTTGDIWLRRTVTLPDRVPADLELVIHHDEDARVYLNGVLAAEVKGFTTNYVEIPIRPEARKALRPGKNTVAVHCRQTGGGQYIDVGLNEIRPR